MSPPRWKEDSIAAAFAIERNEQFGRKEKIGRKEKLADADVRYKPSEQIRHAMLILSLALPPKSPSRLRCECTSMRRVKCPRGTMLSVKMDSAEIVQCPKCSKIAFDGTTKNAAKRLGGMVVGCECRTDETLDVFRHDRV